MTLLVGQQEGHPACKKSSGGCWIGYLSGQAADLHMAQLMLLLITVSCFRKCEIGFTFLVPAYPGSPGQLLQPFYCSLNVVRDNPHEPVAEETFTYSHLSWSSIIPYLLHPSFMIHSILLVQFTCPTFFFHNLSPSFLWSTSWPSTLHFILHTFLHPIIVFFSHHMPIPSQPVLL